jgi:hypothetical protein
MGYDAGNNVLRRQEAVGMDELVARFVREMKLSSGLDRQRVAQAWNSVSGAARYTLGVTFERGVLTCSISSSVVRSRLYMQREAIARRMNEVLEKDELFGPQADGRPLVRTIILR